jgi:hypothetical protein
LCKNYANTNIQDDSVVDEEIGDLDNNNHVYNSILRKPYKRE